MQTTRTPYSETIDVLGRYWKTYGGLDGLLHSAYFWWSFILTALSWATWLDEGWWQQVLSVVPNLLGFSIGVLAVFLSFGSDEFKGVIVGKDDSDEVSPYMILAATFSHFIVIQILSLLTALLAAALNRVPAATVAPFLRSDSIVGMLFWFLGYWLFLYAILLALAAAMALFRVADWYDKFHTRRPQ